MNLYMFRTVGLSIIRSLFIVPSAMVYVIQVCRQLSNRTRIECVVSRQNKFVKLVNLKGKGLPQQAEVAQGVPGRLRLRTVLTFGSTRVVGRQPYAPAAFTPRRNPWYLFFEAESTPWHMVPSVTTEKNPSDTTGNRSRDRPISSAVP